MEKTRSTITLFLAGDVMTGRGIDQILEHPSHPVLYEPYVKDARGYIELAEKANGPIRRRAGPPYIWGDALAGMGKEAPDVRIINLETSVTGSGRYWKGKEVHYRMNPRNIACLTAAKIDVCVLANNHVLDWGRDGLAETLQTLKRANIRTAGAGMNPEEAAAPAVVETEGRGRVLVFGCGYSSSGIGSDWAAAEGRPGVNLLPDLSEKTVASLRDSIRGVKRKNDIVVLSIHWGANWGYDIPEEEILFAHRMIEAGADLVHGHSSHHVKAVEVYRDKPVLYGCGDFLNDYEGIQGYEYFRPELGAMYFSRIDSETGNLNELRMVPTRIRNFRVNRATGDEALLLADILRREGKRFGTGIDSSGDVLRCVPARPQIAA